MSKPANPLALEKVVVLWACPTAENSSKWICRSLQESRTKESAGQFYWLLDLTSRTPLDNLDLRTICIPTGCHCRAVKDQD
jgi:hypothetical protein